MKWAENTSGQGLNSPIVETSKRGYWVLLLGLCVTQSSGRAWLPTLHFPEAFLPTAASAPPVPAEEEGKRCHPEVCSRDAQKELEIFGWRSWVASCLHSQGRGRRVGWGFRVIDI